MEERAARFFSGGHELAGILYGLDEAPRPAPGIVLCQGYTGTKEMFLPILAQAFAEAGYTSLVFDYRGWGESDGPPNRLLPLEQVEDIRSALTFLSLQQGVDPTRLGLYGTSFGGANAVYVAALDARVKCTVVSLAIGSGERWLRSLRQPAQWRELEVELEEDRRTRVLTGASRTVSAFEIVPPSPALRGLMDAARQGGIFTGDAAAITLESVDAILAFTPENVVAAISPRPILFVHAGDDDLVPPDEARRLHARAGEPKGLLLLPGVSHVDFYLGDALEQVSSASLDWFRRHLPLPAAMLRKGTQT